MIFSALAVTYLQSDNLDVSSSINSYYNAFQVSEDYSIGRNLGLSVVNALIIVCVIAVATFGLVLLYKYRCMKCLFGYMILSSALLLGLLGNVLCLVAITKFQIIIDVVTFYFLLYNFAIVGTTSIFFPQNRIPTAITQCYLVATSVILAWQLSQFNSWTAWCLLVALALYDLCAVLTPCGPLKALIGLMSKDGAPDLPGLIYEAQLPEGVKKPKKNNRKKDNEDNANANDTTATTNNGQRGAGVGVGANAETLQRKRQDGESNNERALHRRAKEEEEEEKEEIERDHNGHGIGIRNHDGNNNGNYNYNYNGNRHHFDTESGNVNQHEHQHHQQQRQNSKDMTRRRTRNRAPAGTAAATITAQIPLAIAIIYKLPIESPAEFAISREELMSPTSPTPGNRKSQYSPKQLKTTVVVHFQRGGGYIEAVYPDSEGGVGREGDRNVANGSSNDNNSGNPGGLSLFRRRKQKSDPKPSKYIVYDKHKNVKRILILGDDGKVFEEVDGGGDGGDGGALSANTIKLGLGDFIFYSVLVSKAAQYSFTTFASCMLVILAGLGGTLVLLSVYGKALPALPISIFLGVSFYFLTRALIEPYLIHIIFEKSFYV